jgi:uncharacterized protein
MKSVKRFVFFLSLFFLFPVLAFAQNLPAPTAYVSDFAQVLSSQFEDSLNVNLSGFESRTGNQIAVVTVESLDGLTVEEFSINLAEKWGIGQKDQDNGLLFLFAPNDKKVRIEIGYGLEPFLTDGQSGYILDTEFIPEYKKGNYEQAILNTVNAIESEISDSTQVSTPASSSADFPAYLPLIIIFAIYILSYLSRSKEFVTGGIVGFIIGLLLNGFLAGLFIGAFGLLLDLILSRNYRRARSLGLPTSFGPSLGGFKMGGRSGGGFGGFGGGGFGGGGSSRSL